MRTRRGRSSAGFTLIELVISLAIGMLLLLLAADLLRATQLVFLDSVRDALNPQPRLAAVYLRRDVRSSLGAVGGSLNPTAAPLLLAQPDGSVVRYEMNGPRLERVLIDADGSEVSRRALMQPVESWLWWTPAPGLVEISLGAAERSMERSLLASGPERLAARPRAYVFSLVLAPRLGRHGY